MCREGRKPRRSAQWFRRSFPGGIRGTLRMGALHAVRPTIFRVAEEPRLLRMRPEKPVNGMVRRRSLEVVECGGKEASHEITRARH
jgi:hypothetical protein